MNRKRRPKARKSRTRVRKSKYLSLRLQFPPNGPAAKEVVKPADAGSKKLINLVPVSPEITINEVVEDRESNDHENVALYFSAADGGDTTLTGLLDSTAAAESNSSHTVNNSSRIDYLSQSSASLTHAYSEERAALVRTALRNRDRDSSSEKWVCYSEVVERKVKEEEVTSSAVDLPQADRVGAGIQRVSLKLDYEEIMNAWSNKGPLYLDAESSQIVPDINHHQFASRDLVPSNNGQGMTWGCNAYGGIWTVPEMVGNLVEENSEMRMKNGEEVRRTMTEHREASVLRYKEKRRNRLFSNKIRYQVRKLNAEKRPRLKGRFVKRS